VSEGNRCRKNVTKFHALRRPADRNRTTTLAETAAAERPISVITHTDPVIEYKYLLKPVSDSPLIRVVVPGGPLATHVASYR